MLLLWYSVVLSVYIGVFLFSFGATNANGYSHTVMLPLPVLIFGALISGTRERFSIRTKPSLGSWIAAGLVIAGFLTLGLLNVIEVGYPWWLNLGVAAAAFVTMAVGPVRQLRRARATADSHRWRNEPLNRPVRWTTALIGAGAGLAAATSTQAWSPIVSIAVMLLFATALTGLRAPWGLPRTGYEWGPIHWTAFGFAMAVLFLLTWLLARTDWVTTATSVAAGVLILLVMLLASFLPPRARRSQAAT